MMNRPAPPADPLGIPFLHRSRLRARRLVPMLVWGIVMVATVALYIRQEAGLTVTGFAEETRYDAAPQSAGRLNRLEVELNQDVSRGQIVASFEDDDVLLQLREARAELDRMAHELDREKALWDLETTVRRIDQQTDIRRFAEDVSSAQIEHLVALADLAENRIERLGLELTLNRTRQLEENQLTAVATLDKDRIAYEALGERIAGQEAAAAALLGAYRDAEARYRGFLDDGMADSPDPSALLKPLESAIKVQEIRIEQVTLAIGQRVLRAPADGRVVEILCHPGEMAAAGQAVLSILVPRATGLVAYLPEQRILDIAPGAEVRIRRVADPDRMFSSSVSDLGSSVDRMPQRLNPAGVVPSWGLAVFIPLPGTLEAKPGEAFEITFR